MKIIKNKSFLLTLLSLGFSTFSQHLVAASDTPVANENVSSNVVVPANVEDKAIDRFKAGLVKVDIPAEEKFADEVVDEARTRQHVYLNINPTVGNNAEKLFAAHFATRRIFNYMLKKRPDILERVVGGMFSKEELADVYNEKDFDPFSELCIYGCFFINLFSNIVSSFSCEVFYNLGERTFILFKGIVDGVNELMKDRDFLEEIAKPLTNGEKEEFNKLVQECIKNAEHVLNYERSVEAEYLKIKNNVDGVKQVGAVKKREDFEREILCGAKSNLESESEKLKFLIIHSNIEEFKQSCEKYLDELTRARDKIKNDNLPAPDGSDCVTSQCYVSYIKSYEEQIKNIKELLSNENKLKEEFSAMFSRVQGRVEEARNIITNEEALKKIVDKEMGKVNNNVNDNVNSSFIWDEKTPDRIKALQKNVEIFKNIKFEGVQASYNSMNFLNRENDKFLVACQGDADKPIKEEGLADSKVRRMKDYRKLKNDNAFVYEDIEFCFPKGMNTLSKCCLFLLLKHIVAKFCMCDFFDDSRNSFHGDDLIFFEAEKGRIYFEGSCINSSCGYPKKLSYFLNPDNNVLSFRVKAKNADDLNKFNDKLPNAIKNILANLHIEEEYVNNCFKKTLKDVVYSYFNTLDAIYKREHFVDSRSFPVYFSSQLQYMFRLFGSLAPSLSELIKYDENDENLKKRFASRLHFNRCEIESGIDKYGLGGLSCAGVGLDEIRGLLTELLKNVEGLDINCINSIENNGKSLKSFINLIKKDSCCFQHSGIKLKGDVVKGVLDAADSFARSLPDGGFGLSFVPAKGEMEDSVCNYDYLQNFFEELRPFEAGEDFAFIEALDKDKGVLERAKGDLLKLQETFKFLSDKGNVEGLTPIQRRKIVFKYMFIRGGMDRALNSSTNPFEDAQDLEVESICDFSAHLVKYVGALVKVIDGKLGV